MSTGRVALCRHCGYVLSNDVQGRPIHATGSYTCRDQWGAVAGSYAAPIAPGTAPAHIIRECRTDLR